jgi:hypothetical protein
MKVFERLVPALVVSGLLSVSADAQTPVGPWEIGPIIQRRNYSAGMPYSPSRDAKSLRFAIGPRAEPHYVTFRHGSLRGRSQIRMRFRIVGPNGAIVHGAKCPPNTPATVTLYFQRKSDDWATDGGRWWATFASVQLKSPMAETEIVAPLNAIWTSVSSMTAANSPDAFSAAKANADRVGFTFGNCEGYGHGARATSPVTFVVTRFQVL